MTNSKNFKKNCYQITFNPKFRLQNTHIHTHKHTHTHTHTHTHIYIYIYSSERQGCNVEKRKEMETH